MKFGKIKKLLIGLTFALVVCFAAVASGCSNESDHPKAQITYEFNGVEYTVDYVLYRNMYPQTVRHFIELADEGYYNNMIIHDYQTNDWITGAYSCDKERYDSFFSSGAETMKEYFIDCSKEREYYDLFKAGKLTPSVYTKYNDVSVERQDALPTVMGEFYNNINQVIENGALTADYGCLKMYYYSKETKNKVYVTPTSDQTIMADYKNNCATSMFAIQTGTSSSLTESKYCVFAKVKKTEDFDSFVNAVKDYFADQDTSEYQLETKANVDNNRDCYPSEFVAEADIGKEINLKVTKTPIRVVSVKIKKY